VFRRRGEDRPDRVAELRAAPRWIDIDAEFFPIPAPERVSIVRFEKYTADSCDFFYVSSSS